MIALERFKSCHEKHFTTQATCTGKPLAYRTTTAFGRSAFTTLTDTFRRATSKPFSLNNITSRKSADGSVSIQFGGCNGHIENCLPIMGSWNYTVRLYRPREEVLNGK